MTPDMKMIEEIMNDISDTWRNVVKVDNPNDNPLCDAYNDGVDALANHIVRMLSYKLRDMAEKEWGVKK